MKTTSIMPVICALALAVVPATSMQADQEKVAAAIREARAETLQTGETLKAAVVALDALSKQTKGDLKPAYDVFVDKVANTHAAAQVTRHRVSTMNTNGTMYFQTWQQSIDSMTNADLKKSAQKRLNTVKTSFDKIFRSMGQSVERFGPFLSDLNDVQKALALDTTPGGVKSVKDVASSAKSNFNKVAEAVNEALAEMNKVEKALSSQAG